MRPIKFRAWDKDAHKMYRVGAIQFHSSMGVAALGTMLPDEMLVTPEFQLHLILMQYTGLKDKNGVDVYEDDIIHVWDNGVAVVKFDESLDRGQWMCEFLADAHGGAWPAPMYNWIEGNVDGSVFEILGNIYENPELLEVAEHDAD